MLFTARQDEAMASPLPTSVLDLAPAVPVVVIEDVSDAVPLARALVTGGLPAIEVTLRTPAALDAIREIAAEVPDAVVGAGTVITPDQVNASVAAGARFLVSPAGRTYCWGRCGRPGCRSCPGCRPPRRSRRCCSGGYGR
jgi:Entner-Doudoroff aldolase